MPILSLPASVVNFDFADNAPEADEYRPSPEPDFIPTPEEEAEASELFNNTDDEPTDAEWEAMAEAAHALEVVCRGYAWL